MRRFRWVLAVFMMASGGCAGQAAAQTTVVTPGSVGTSWLDGSPINTQIIVGESGETFVGVWIEAPDEVPTARRRAPMALSLVVDTSGSMSGEKIQYARHATSSLLESLRDGDRVSIYAFDDRVTEVAPPTTVGPNTRAALMRRVSLLQTGGGTNMYDALTVGVARIAEAPASHTVRRVVLISDGHANVGLSDPRSLGDVAARGTEHGAQVTAIGVGLGYDENTLGAIAVRSSGRLYHLAQPHQMAHILEQEMNLLARTVATDAYIEIVPAPGVVIIEGVSLGSTLQNGRLRVPLGSLYAGQQRDVLFRARVDTARMGRRALASARLVYRAPSGRRAEHRQSADLRYRVTRDRQAARRSVVPRINAMVATHEAAQAQVRAAEMLNRGDQRGAVAELDTAARRLQSAADAAPRSESSRELRRRAGRVTRQRSAAGSASTPSATRGAALEVYDDAMESAGY